MTSIVMDVIITWAVVTLSFTYKVALKPNDWKLVQENEQKGVREDDQMKTKELDGEVKRILKCPQLAEVRITDKSDSNIVDQIREAKMILDI